MWKIIKRSTVSHVFLVAILVSSGLFINLVMVVNYLLIQRLHKPFSYTIKWGVLTWVNYMALTLLEHWGGVQTNLYMDEKDIELSRKENSIIVLNHSYEIDFAFIPWFSNFLNLIGSTRPIFKKSVIFVPALGVSYFFCDSIFLKKENSAEDLKIIKEKTAILKKYPHPIHHYLYPEGTRFTEEKLKLSHQFADENNLPKFKYHLGIRTKGFIELLNCVRNSIGAIYDITIQFENSLNVKPNFINLFNGESVPAHVYVKRYPIHQIPVNPEDIKEFLWNMFKEKDLLVERFKTTGSFCNPGLLKPFKTSWGIKPIVCMALWFLLILGFLLNIVIKAMVKGEFLNFWIVLIIFTGLYMTTKRIESYCTIKTNR